jgi:hypothetical protein
MRNLVSKHVIWVLSFQYIIYPKFLYFRGFVSQFKK